MIAFELTRAGEPGYGVKPYLTAGTAPEEATYEPASRAGTPVAIASPVSVEFELMGDGSGSGASVLARAWFENALAARQTPEEK
jgi:hypothetical protein